MNCEFCREPLNPYLNKAIPSEDGMVYEIECLKCRKVNVVNEEMFRAIFKDFKHPTVQPINKKFPSEMNVIFTSMPRSGISWVIGALSPYHYQMFGKPITFTPEIPEQKAKRKDKPLPKGWSNIYEIDPQILLDRIDPEGLQYDRVICIERSLETTLKVNRLALLKKGLDPDHVDKILTKMEAIYPKIMKDIDDPRYLKISLEDINNYPTASMNELMDFFNFPKIGRPPVVDFKPHWFERNWEFISTMLKKGQSPVKFLHNINADFMLTKDGLLELLMSEDLEDNQLQNVLVIGPGFDKGCHMSENITEAFIKKGYNAQLLDLVELGYYDTQMKPYNQKKRLYKISEALKHVDFTPDLIFFDEPYWYFENDTKILSFYYHRDFERNPMIYYPKVAYFWHQEVISDFRSQWGHPHWSEKTRNLRIMPPAFNPSQFNINQEKTIKGVTCLAGRETMKGCLQVREPNAQQYLNQSLREIIEYIDLGLNWIESEKGGLTDEEFRELLPQCESLWICLPLRQYMSRRMFEAMYCKTVCIFITESEVHVDILKDLGFYPNEHYIQIKNVSDMVELNKNWNYEDYKEMIDNAHEVVVNNHTFEYRVDFIVNEYKEFKKKGGVIVE